ncbi:hypothetical protein IAT38_001769 [Cryptococcus sp. DSM 104549]
MTSPGKASLSLGSPHTPQSPWTPSSESDPLIAYLGSSPTPSPDRAAYRQPPNTFQHGGPPQQQKFNYDVKNGVTSQWSDWGSERTRRGKADKNKGGGGRRVSELGMEDRREGRDSAGWLKKLGKNEKEETHSGSPRRDSEPNPHPQSYTTTTLSPPSHPNRPPRPGTEYCPSVLHQPIAATVPPQPHPSEEETHGGGCGIFRRKTKKRPPLKTGDSIVVQRAPDAGSSPAKKLVSPRGQRSSMMQPRAPVEEETLERYSGRLSDLKGRGPVTTAQRVSPRQNEEIRPPRQIQSDYDTSSIAYLRRELSSDSPPRKSRASHDEHQAAPMSPVVSSRQSQETHRSSPSHHTHSRTHSRTHNRTHSRTQSTDQAPAASRPGHRSAEWGPARRPDSAARELAASRAGSRPTSSTRQSQGTNCPGHVERALSPWSSATSAAERYTPQKALSRGHVAASSWDSKVSVRTTPDGHRAHRHTRSADSQGHPASNVGTPAASPTRLRGQTKITSKHEAHSASATPHASPTKQRYEQDEERDVSPPRPQRLLYQQPTLPPHPTIPSPLKQATLPNSAPIPDSPTPRREQMRDADEDDILHPYRYAVPQPLEHRSVSTVATFHSSHLAMPNPPPFMQDAEEEMLLSSDDARSVSGYEEEVSTVGTVGTAGTPGPGVDLARRAVVTQTYLEELFGEYADDDAGTDRDEDVEGSGVSYYDDETEKEDLLSSKRRSGVEVESDEELSEVDLEPVRSTAPLRVMSKTRMVDATVMPGQEPASPVPAVVSQPVKRDDEETMDMPELEAGVVPATKVQNTLRVPLAMSSKGGWALHKGKWASRTSLRVGEAEDEDGLEWDLDSYYGGVSGSVASRE